MNEINKPIHNFHLATIIITYYCPISCPMCFLQCGPNRTELVDHSLAVDLVNQIADLGIPFLGLTGGEPFCARKLLNDLSYKASSIGLKVIVVTNGFWAVSQEVAKKILSELKELGVTRLQVSLDDQHQKSIPIERVAYAVKTAAELDFEDVKLISSTKGNSEKFKYQLIYLQELLGVNISLLDLIDRPRVSHASFLDEEQQRYSFEEIAENNIFRPNDCLTQLMIDIDGTVYPCCNNFVGSIGNINKHSLRDIVFRSQKNPYIERMWNAGPIGLAHYLDNEHGTNFCQGKYESWCALCEKMFSDTRFKKILEYS